MLKIILYFFAIIALIIIGGLITFNLAGRDAAGYVGDFKPEISQIGDGEYTGEYTFLIDKIGAKIHFEVQEGRLDHFSFDRLYGTIGYGAPENVKLQITQKDDLDFDGVSGATVTSNFARAAIKNALENGPAE